MGLIGSRPSGGGSIRYGSTSPAAGVGTLRADFAVENAVKASNYETINGLQSEIDGLGHWLNLWAHRTTVTKPHDSKQMIVATTLELPPDLKLARKLNLCATVVGTAPTSLQPEMRYTSTALLETYSKTSKSWADHFATHRAIRDLLRVVIWKPVVFQAHRVTSDNEKVTVRDEEGPQSRWCSVRTDVTGIGTPAWGKNERPLFLFADIGTAGIARWMRLYETNRRGLRPFLRLLDIREGNIDEHLTQLGIAVEALGYQAFVESGVSEAGSDNKKLWQRMRKLVDEVSNCVPNIPANFPKEFADGYNAVKHASRPEPVSAELITHYRLGVKILRAWIALQLGVPEKTVSERLN